MYLTFCLPNGKFLMITNTTIKNYGMVFDNLPCTIKILNKLSNCVVEIRIGLFYECTLLSANMKIIQMLTAQWTSTYKINYVIEIPEFFQKKSWSKQNRMYNWRMYFFLNYILLFLGYLSWADILTNNRLQLTYQHTVIQTQIYTSHAKC